MSAVGVKIDQFELSVCNSFEAKILNDQLCYEVDLDRYKDINNLDKYLKLGLLLFMDYNEDRQVTCFDEYLGNIHDDSLVASIDSSVGGKDKALIVLNTLGKNSII